MDRRFVESVMIVVSGLWALATGVGAVYYGAAMARVASVLHAGPELIVEGIVFVLMAGLITYCPAICSLIIWHNYAAESRR